MIFISLLIISKTSIHLMNQEKNFMITQMIKTFKFEKQEENKEFKNFTFIS